MNMQPASRIRNGVRKKMTEYIPKDKVLELWRYWKFIEAYDQCKEMKGIDIDLTDGRPQGEWIDAEIPLESGGSMPIQACSLCKTFYPLAYTGGGHRFCPNCGAQMKGV